MQNLKIITAVFTLILLGFVFCPNSFANNNQEFIPGQDCGFYYTVKKGDTLWDLSGKFYNSQWDWPGLWQMNDDIKNPHLIYPGKKIQLFLKEKPDLKPKIVNNKQLKKTDEPVKIQTSFSFSRMDQVGFIRKKTQPSLGSIIKEQENNIMMSTNDTIYIKPSGRGTLIPGRSYHIYTTEKIEEKINNQTFKGIKHLIKGEIKIVEHKTTYATALITKTYRDISKEDLVMNLYKRDSVLTVEEDPDPVDAQIICSENNDLMINDYRIAFIDKGKTDVKPGQIYTVMRKNKSKDHSLWNPGKHENIKLENLESGKLIVLHTEEIASSVMILSSKYAIQPNDIVN